MFNSNAPAIGSGRSPILLHHLLNLTKFSHNLGSLGVFEPSIIFDTQSTMILTTLANAIVVGVAFAALGLILVAAGYAAALDHRLKTDGILIGSP